MALYLLESPLFIVPPEVMLGNDAVDQGVYAEYEALYSVAEAQLDALAIMDNKRDAWKFIPYTEAIWRTCIEVMHKIVKDYYPMPSIST